MKKERGYKENIYLQLMTIKNMSCFVLLGEKIKESI